VARDIGAGDFFPYRDMLIMSMGEAISSELACIDDNLQEALGGV
jgi:hypothetical protein